MIVMEGKKKLNIVVFMECSRHPYEIQGRWEPNVAAANCYANSRGEHDDVSLLSNFFVTYYSIYFYRMCGVAQ